MRIFEWMIKAIPVNRMKECIYSVVGLLLTMSMAHFMQRLNGVRVILHELQQIPQFGQILSV